ncbi:MAG: thioredoxin family protein [Gammaproteobacteria bacterium]|jgi:thioredoxin 1|nr:thioredoxin family protein [Gammaproteobacteria bacterium]MBT6043671.1 thioredoxin family protein [Gammaproteobacteria bacterium]
MLVPYSDTAHERDTLDATPGPLILEFGSNSCGICQAAAPLISEAMASSTIAHIRVQDGKGKRLGRSYRVKLWPTLILLLEGKEVGRVVRPSGLQELQNALKLLQG